MPSDEILLVARLLNRTGLFPDLDAQDATQLRNVAGDIVEFGPDGWVTRRADPLDLAALAREAGGTPLFDAPPLPGVPPRFEATERTFARRIFPEGHPDAVWDEMVGEYLESDESLRRRILDERAGEPGDPTGDGPNGQ